MKHSTILVFTILIVAHSLVGQSPMTELQSPIGLPERRVAEEMHLFQQLRDGVVTIEAEGGKGTGFIVDELGLIVTNSHVISGSVQVRVAFDEKRKVRAEVLVSDPQEDIAVLWVDLSAYPEHRVLRIAEPKEGEPTVIEGERVFVIGSPMSRTKILTLGIISEVEEEVIFSDVNINPGNSGGPMFNSIGEVIGITAFIEHANFGPGLSGIIRIDRAIPLIEEARKMTSTVRKPSARLLPVMPDIPFPIAGLARAITDEDYGAKHYAMDTKNYEIEFVTPVLSWYHIAGTRIEAARRKLKKREKEKDVVSTRFDPFEDMQRYGKYLGFYDAVVTIVAQPKIKETTKSVWARVLLAGLAGFAGTTSYRPGRYVFAAEFYEMRLFCDNRVIAPIARGRTEWVGQVQSYYGSDAHYTYYGQYKYPSEVFDPRNCSHLEIQIFSEEDASAPDRKAIKSKIMLRVWEDFSEYRDILVNLAKGEGDSPGIKGTESRQHRFMRAYLIKSLIGSENPEATLKFTSEFLHLYPRSPYESTIHLAAAQAYQTLTDYEKAISSAELALQLEPNNIMARLVVAKALIGGSGPNDRADRLEESKRHLEDALSLLAESYSSDKESSNINPIAWAGKGIFLESQARATLGYVYLLMEEYELAERELNLSLTLNEGTPNGTDFLSLINVYMRQQNWEAASEVVDRAENANLGGSIANAVRSYRKQIEQGRVGQ